MTESRKGSSRPADDPGDRSRDQRFSVHGVRYQVTDVARAVAFYTEHLGFTLERQQLPAFASVSLGGGCSNVWQVFSAAAAHSASSAAY